ncbi:MAG: ThuA domain-containing protein [Phycisphaerae bacterium]|nr:ThuA domain-containing protein [Phycisphaerae bacterium]
MKTPLLLLLACIVLAVLPDRAAAAADKFHVVFLIAEREYGTAETLPAFARKHLHPQGVKTSFIFAQGSEGAARNRFGAFDPLKTADLLVISVRRRAPSQDQMAVLRKWVGAKKPIVALRTASHAFALRGDAAPPKGHLLWPTFDRDVLGAVYRGHYGGATAKGEPATRLFPGPGSGKHPVMQGVTLPPASGIQSHLYRSEELDKRASVLLLGKPAERDEKQPVAWTLIRDGHRVFYTSLGSREDMQMTAVQRLLRNAVYWAADRQVPIG